MTYGLPKNINDSINDRINNYCHNTVYALLDDPFNLQNKTTKF